MTNRWLLAISLGVWLGACAGAGSELSDSDTTLTDEKANPYAFNRSVANTLLRTQQPAEALRVIRRLIDLDADSAEPYYLLGRAYVDLRQWKPAERALRVALKRNPEYSEAYSMLGMLLDMLDRHAEAASAHLQALKLAPDKAELHNNLGFHYYLRRNYAAAAKQFEAALEGDPASHRTHNNLGFAYGKLGRMDLAFQHFQLAGPPAQATNNLGVVYEERGNLEQAFEAFNAACRIDPRLVPSRANLARVSERLGRPMPELPSTQIALREPEDPSVAAAAAVESAAPSATEPTRSEPAL